MVQRVVVQLTDDIDGSEAVETVSYALDGTTYEVDLNEKHAADLRKAFEKYIGVSRKAGRGAKAAGTSRSTRSKSDYDAKAVRAWASSQNIEVNERGRIPSEIVEQYKAAGN